MLAPLGRELVTAGSGEEALRRLLDGDFAVIVMDVRMPGLDGFETVELIKRRPRHADTAVVFLTAADADVDQITRGYESGAVDYILKPVDPDILRSKVAMLLELQEKNAALRASEERFRTAFEGAPIGMALSTMEGDFARGERGALRAARRSGGRGHRAPALGARAPRRPPGRARRSRSGSSRSSRASTSASCASSAPTSGWCTRS